MKENNNIQTDLTDKNTQRNLPQGKGQNVTIIQVIEFEFQYFTRNYNLPPPMRPLVSATKRKVEIKMLYVALP